MEAVSETMRPAIPAIWWLGLVSGILALVTAFIFYRQIMSRSEGTPKMIEIAAAVREGAMAYLRQQYRIIAISFGVLFAVFLVMSLLNLQNPFVPFGLLTGGFLSALSGYIGMRAATSASARTAQAASESLNSGLQVALRAGAIMGLVVVGFTLLDISFWFLMLYVVLPGLMPDGMLNVANPLPIVTATMLSFGIGASTQALFARVGGGIFTKAADVGADLVGKVEAGIPEDDPRNPATIADNVGDNVGDVAGMGADLYESYAGAILATSALGVAAVAAAGTALGGGAFSLPELQIRYMAAPVAIAAVGLILSILAVFVVRADSNSGAAGLISALNRGLYLSSLGIAILSIPVLYVLNIPNWLAIWVSIIIGLIAGMVVGRATEYYTSHAFGPTRSIAAQADTSSATALIEGLAVGMESGGLPVAAIAVAIAASYFVVGGIDNIQMGLYGVGMAAVGMLSTLAFTLATDAYGPIADNAGGNAEMAGLDKSVRVKTDQLDAAGNTTAAIGKGFAIGSAALTSLALLAAYVEAVRLALGELRGVAEINIASEVVRVMDMTIPQFATYYNITLFNPLLLIGLFAGAATTFYFSAMTMRAVGRAAGGMVEEVRRQFREKPGILDGTERPDYARCVAISTASAQRQMVAPAVVALVVPLVTGVLFGVAGVIGLLAGGLATGLSLAIMMSNAGGAWDNAKKYIEEGEHGGKGSAAHKAAVVGDTVGDPFKDTSGPALNILIKLMAMVSLVFAGLVVFIANGQGLLMMLFG